MNKKIQNLLHSRRVAKRTPRVLQACAEACACDRTPLSDKPVPHCVSTEMSHPSCGVTPE